MSSAFLAGQNGNAKQPSDSSSWPRRATSQPFSECCRRTLTGPLTTLTRPASSPTWTPYCYVRARAPFSRRHRRITADRYYLACSYKDCSNTSIICKPRLRRPSRTTLRAWRSFKNSCRQNVIICKSFVFCFWSYRLIAEEIKCVKLCTYISISYRMKIQKYWRNCCK